MFGRRERIMERLLKSADIFQKKGAVSPEKALTIEELGLPPEFKKAMERRLGQLGLFTEVNGKYYLSEERFKELRERLTRQRSHWW